MKIWGEYGPIGVTSRGSVVDQLSYFDFEISVMLPFAKYCGQGENPEKTLEFFAIKPSSKKKRDSKVKTPFHYFEIQENS